MIYRPLKPITKIKDAIFLAGPTPRVGIEYNDPCEWREEFIDILRGKGFTGDFIDPINPNFNQSNLAKQIKWEWEGLRLACVIAFWIPRSKEHPALTTNIELGEWLDNPTTFVGWNREAIKNDYIEQRCKMIGKPVFHTIEKMADKIISYFNEPKRWFATSDTHFGMERTLQLSRRPFRTVEEMDFALISNWNKKIRSKDGIIHLGDFGSPIYYPKLNFGEMKLVLGNYEIKDGYTEPDDKRVQVIPSNSSITYRGKKYYLTHETISPENDLKKFYLFGHIHRLQIVKRNGINVGTDCYRFSPVDFDEIEFLRGGIENHFDENVFTESVKNGRLW